MLYCFFYSSVDELSTFQWIQDCDYKGGDLEISPDANSLVQCAVACFSRKDCNFFTFGANKKSDCILKNNSIFDETKTIVSQGSFCGMITKRIGIKSPSAGGQWKTSPDGTYQWDTSCKYEGRWIERKSNTISTMAACADFCKANPDCNFFDLRIGSQGCQLSKSNDFFAETRASDPGCGFIVSRRYNVEYLPKCNGTNTAVTAAPTDYENYVDPIETDEGDDGEWLAYY